MTASRFISEMLVLVICFCRVSRGHLLTKFFSLTHSFNIVLQVKVSNVAYDKINGSVEWLHESEG